MKRAFLRAGLIIIAMGLFLLTACSNDSDENPEPSNGYYQPGDIVSVYPGVNGVYEPISYQDAPEWIKPILEKEGWYNIYLFQGERHGEIIYLKHSDLDSSSVGYFYDQNGEMIIIETSYESYFSETSNWKLIFYHKIY